MPELLESLRQRVFGRVEKCRDSLKEGNADLSGLEEGVREYCIAIAGLPKSEGQSHEKHLNALMLEIEALNVELSRAQDSVRTELASLGRMKQANVAYHRTDAIGPEKRRKQEED